MIYILGIESSCDDTAAAVTVDNRILSNVTASQEVHRNFGGVVPELASRAHQQNIIPVIHAALQKANIHKNQLSAVAFTRGTGLLGSLLAVKPVLTLKEGEVAPMTRLRSMSAASDYLYNHIANMTKIEMLSEMYPPPKLVGERISTIWHGLLLSRFTSGTDNGRRSGRWISKGAPSRLNFSICRKYGGT